jgi:hypothetical protein
MRYFRVLWFLAILLFLHSCIARDKKQTEATDPDYLYFDYQVIAEEGNDNLTVLLQYREDDEEGEPVSVSRLGTVSLDGEELPGDSTRRTGFFYETHQPINTFTGQHRITFTMTKGKEYEEEFDFQPVVLLTPVADTLVRGEWELELQGLEPEDYVRVLLTDTSFAHDGINRVDTVRNGRLVIPTAEMESLAPGPVQLELIREYERPVKNGTAGGGRLLINYTIRRQFFLKDQPEK